MKMLDNFLIHNRFKKSLPDFLKNDPQLMTISKLRYQSHVHWWEALSLDTPGIYILTGGRQVGKSTSCKQLIASCLEQKKFAPKNIFYLPCDEIFDAQALSKTIKIFLDQTDGNPFLLVVDEVTFVKHWERVIKSLADEAWFKQGICLLTGSDSLILKEAAMSFPGRRGEAEQTDFHLYPLSFSQYVSLMNETSKEPSIEKLAELFETYLVCGGYLRAINDIAEHGKILEATYQTYEQWIRGDFIKHGKNENYLLNILAAFIRIGVSQISFSSLNQNIGLMSKETLINYYNLLERMDVLFNLQAYDISKKQGFPKKARKFHFVDPFIQNTIFRWVKREGVLNGELLKSNLVEACVASHCHRMAKSFYFKGQGEVDVIMQKEKFPLAIEVKWAEQIRPIDLKTLKQFKHAVLLTKQPHAGTYEHITSQSVYEFLYHLM